MNPLKTNTLNSTNWYLDVVLSHHWLNRGEKTLPSRLSLVWWAQASPIPSLQHLVLTFSWLPISSSAWGWGSRTGILIALPFHSWVCDSSISCLEKQRGPEDSTAPAAGSSRIQAFNVGFECDDKHCLTHCLHEWRMGMVKSELYCLLSFMYYMLGPCG